MAGAEEARLSKVGGGGGLTGCPRTLDLTMKWASQVVLVVNLPADAGDIRGVGSIPGLGRSSGGGNDNPL